MRLWKMTVKSLKMSLSKNRRETKYEKTEFKKSNGCSADCINAGTRSHSKRF